MNERVIEQMKYNEYNNEDSATSVLNNEYILISGLTAV